MISRFAPEHESGAGIDDKYKRALADVRSKNVWWLHPVA